MLLDGDPELVPDDLLRSFAWHSSSCFDKDEYEAAWRRLAYRVIQVLEDTPDTSLTFGMTRAKSLSWPEDERAVLREQFTGAIMRAVADEERRPNLNGLIQSAAHLDEDLTPWLRLVDSLPDEVIVHLAKGWSYDVYFDNGRFGSWLHWEDPTSGEQMQEWLLRPALRDRLSGMDSEAAQDALKHLRWLAGDFSTR
jgi:hypothetical protein